MQETDCLTFVLSLSTPRCNTIQPRLPALTHTCKFRNSYKVFQKVCMPCPVVSDLRSSYCRPPHCINHDEDLSQKEFIPTQNLCLLNKDMLGRCVFIGYRSVYCYLPWREKPAWYAGVRLSFNPARNAWLGRVWTRPQNSLSFVWLTTRAPA